MQIKKILKKTISCFTAFVCTFCAFPSEKINDSGNYAIPINDCLTTYAATTYNAVFPINNGVKIAYYQQYDPNYPNHDGIDIHSSGNDTVYAAKGGTVYSTANECTHVNYAKDHTDLDPHYSSGGNSIVIKGDDGIYYWYFHLLHDSLKVKKGDKVSAGQPIATMGSSGQSTGKHLHLTMTTTTSYSSKIIANPVGKYNGQVNYSNGPYLDDHNECVNITAGNYYLKNSSTNSYVQAAGASNTAKISLAAKKETSAFLLNLTGSKSAGYYLATKLNTDYVVNPYSDTPTKGTIINVYKKDNSGTQLWEFDKSGNGYIIHLKNNANLCLTADGTGVKLDTRTGAANQIWILEDEKPVTTTYNAIFPVNNGVKIAYYQQYDPNYPNHDGIDIHSSGDDTIYAAKGGTVYSTANECTHVNYAKDHTDLDPHYSSGGNSIVIKGDDGIYYWYFHLLHDSLKVKKGDKVTAGQPIATMGSSGQSTGKHLHLTMTTTTSYSSKIIANPVGKYNGQVNYSNGPYLDDHNECVNITAGNYYLKNSSTNSYVQAADASNTAKISLAAKKETSAFLLNLTGSKSAGYYLATKLNTDYVVNPYSDTPTKGTIINVYKKDNSGTQLWEFDKSGNGYIIHLKNNADLCLTADGTGIKLDTRTGAANQIWILEDEKPTTTTTTTTNTTTTTTTNTTTTTTVVSVAVTLLGDANEDGEVNIADATAITQHLGNKDKYGLSEQGLINADCCNVGDGVTGLDALALQKLEANIISKLPDTSE